MTNEEIKNALFSGCQVEHNGIIYKCVSAIIYRLREGKLLFAGGAIRQKLQQRNYCGRVKS